jgi:hypothetical protein
LNVGYDNVDSGFGEPVDDRPSDALGSPGDDRDAIG